MNSKRGATSILGAVSLGATIIIALSSFFVSRLDSADKKIDDNFKDLSDLKSQVSSLSEAVGQLKVDSTEIKSDLKEVLKAVK